MARIFKNIHIFGGRWPLAGKSNEVSLDYSVDEKEVTSLLDSTLLSFPGLMKVEASVKGFLDYGLLTAAAIDPILWDQVANTTAIPWSFVVGSDNVSGAVGDPAFFFQAFTLSGSPFSGGLGDVHPFEVKLSNANSGGRLVRGSLMAPYTSYNVTGNRPSQQLGVVPDGQKLYVAIHVMSVGTSVEVVVQSGDSSFTTPTARVDQTFTDAGEMWVAVDGDSSWVDDYYRVRLIPTGGAATLAVMVGIA